MFFNVVQHIECCKHDCMYDSELDVILNFQSMIPVNTQGVGSRLYWSASTLGNCSMTHSRDISIY